MERSRREFIRDATGLVIGFSLIDTSLAPQVLAQRSTFPPGAPGRTVPAPDRLDGWLLINPAYGPGYLVQVFTGKVEIGMGVETALAQIIAEELDVPVDRVFFVMGDTAQTPDQGGVGGSTSISQGANPLRNAAALARAVLLRRASEELNVPVADLSVRDGVVTARTTNRTTSYSNLLTSLTDVPLRVTGQGFGLNVQGDAKPKSPADYTLVGTAVPRVDLPPKLTGTFSYITDVRIAGMLHGRVIRPAGVGAKLQRVDDSAAKSIAGYVRTVTKGDFVGVVAENEWAAIKAAKAVKVTWSAPLTVFSTHERLYDYLRTTPPKSSRDTLKRGEAAMAIAGAAKVVEATYEFPFQSHATMGPGCAVADVKADGVTTVWSGAQKPHAMQRAFAELLGVPLERVRVVWVEDSGSYGRAGFEDVACDAVLLSQAAGRPVRVQWMRDDMTAWGPKGPPVVSVMRAGLDAGGEVVGLEYTSYAFSGNEVNAVPQVAGNFLGAQLAGVPAVYGGDEFAEWSRMAPPYAFTNVLARAHLIAGFHPTASPLRSTHLRDPEGPAVSFAVESFIDELARAAGADPIEFRVKYYSEPRAKAVLEAAAEKAGWQRRGDPLVRRTTSGPDLNGPAVTGRGVSLGVRNGTYVATIADVEVNRRTGVVRVTRFVCAHDCGLVVNPDGLTRTIEANLMQSISRTLKEETTFDRSRVTSVDWPTYGIVRASDVPDAVDIVLVNRKDLPPGGAGEPSSRAIAAAIGSAIFDATGVRLRRVPFTPARVVAGLRG
ncbi:MAG TPA: molybdopterin cofactor-binding domain-containing protein [Vicinamibacterales bacterium]|nr:molybdopterin cofactor-binding domain-containing protein [Vicinamibacterales bacterium]